MKSTKRVLATVQLCLGALPTAKWTLVSALKNARYKN